jgi:hypothetical protein
MTFVQINIENFDEHWDIGDLNPPDLVSAISEIHFVAYRNEGNVENSAGRLTNHWTVFLKTGKESSIRMDMSPDMSLDGVIRVWSKDYAATGQGIKVVSAPINGEHVTLNNIADVIVALDRHLFRFTETIEGCRHWMMVLAEDLEQADFVPKGTAKEVAQAVSMYWRDPEGSEPSPIIEGIFAVDHDC